MNPEEEKKESKKKEQLSKEKMRRMKMEESLLKFAVRPHQTTGNIQRCTFLSCPYPRLCHFLLMRCPVNNNSPLQVTLP